MGSVRGSGGAEVRSEDGGKTWLPALEVALAFPQATPASLFPPAGEISGSTSFHLLRAVILQAPVGMFTRAKECFSATSCSLSLKPCLSLTRRDVQLLKTFSVLPRPRRGVWDYVRVNVSELPVEELTVSEYLAFKEQLVDEHASSKFVLELDFEPFNASFPRPSMSKSIGNGVQFLNRHLSTNLFQDKESLYPLLNFLKAHNHKGTTMMLNDRIQSLRGLQSALRKADEYLTSIPEDTPSSEFNHREDERLYLANDSDEQSLLCDTLMLSISEHDGEWLIGKQIKGQEIKRMVNVVDSVKEVANMIEVVDAVRQNKKLCHHIRGRMDCRCATLSKLDDAGARKDPID
ncbi:hypothetical protein ACQ4PT_039568 [Festuca glaucescens]